MIRRLAAILAADVVGYSRLMGEDEAATLAALRRLRAELFHPSVAGNRGKVIKNMGDGWIVTFTTAAEAVTCAMQIQDRLIDDPLIRLRIGVHIGDIVEEDEDVFGDGVNLAARLEAFAPPGAIAISGAVHGGIDGALRPSFTGAGAQDFKNIDRPVDVWLRGGKAPASAAADDVRGGRRRLAVIPVECSDERGEARELAAALTSDFGAYLGAVGWLNTRISEARVGADYLLDTRLRVAGSRLSLDAALSRGDEVVIWRDKFDGDLGDVFDWQDQVGEEVTAAALGAMYDRERRGIGEREPEEMTAEECLIAGQISWRGIDDASFADALRYNAAAIEHRPDLAEAYAQALSNFLFGASNGNEQAIGPYRARVPGWIATATPLAADNALLEAALGVAAYQQNHNAPKLRQRLETALAAAPFNVFVLAVGAWGHIWLGEPEPALQCAERGARLGRRHPLIGGILGAVGRALVMAGRDNEAIATALRAREIAPDYKALHSTLAAAYAMKGDLDSAREAMAEVLRINPGDTVTASRDRIGYRDTPATRHYFEGLRRAGMPE